MCPYENTERRFLFSPFSSYLLSRQRVSFLVSVCTVAFCANKWYQSTSFAARSKISICENVGWE